MYSIINKLNKDYSGWKLSYIDEIPSEIYESTPETKAYFETEEYKRNIELYGYSRQDPKIVYKNYPNPEYTPGTKEIYAYFSPVKEMGEVYGDDHDDTPYEHNAGIPYDTSDNDKEIEVLMIPFALPISSFWRGSCEIDMKQPKDYGCGNSPFSAEDINLGAVPWIFTRTCNYKYGNKGISIMAGISPKEFLEKVQEIKNLVKSYITEDNFTVLGKSNGLWIVRNNKTYAIRGFNDLGEQQILYWVSGYYNDSYQVFETYEDDYKGEIDSSIPAPNNLIDRIKDLYL